MIKQVTQFRVIVNDLENIFHFDSSASTNIAKEACLACLKWIGKIEDEAARIASEAKDSEDAIDSPAQEEVNNDQFGA